MASWPFARAYRLIPGEGWQINPGILHAPGSLVTYEPQVNSDVFAMFQSEVEGRLVDRSLLIKDVKPEFANDVDYLVSMLDWEGNVNPEFAKSNKTLPRPVHGCKKWKMRVIASYGSLTALRTTLPRNLPCFLKSVTIRDSEAYGVIVTQGYGLIAGQPLAAPTMIRFGQMTEDEVFVTAPVAHEGVKIENLSGTDPLVLLKHFGPRQSGRSKSAEEMSRL